MTGRIQSSGPKREKAAHSSAIFRALRSSGTLW
jgi:hypothetical protein